ncbi:MAG: hypothetical protein M1162_04945 [Candidatus Thermoplasmatota archaeon]|nr:hypothetical protein [Candidatus Thermoplasmatota archaeon]
MVLALIITVPAGVFLLPSHGILPAGHSGNNNVVGTQPPSGHYSYVNSALSNLKATSNGNAAGARYIYNFLQVSGTSYDSQNGLIYASDGFAASITVYNPNTRSVVGFIGGSSYFGPSVYDPANNFLYVIGGSNDVLVINCSSERIVDTIGGIGVAYNNFILSPSCTMTFNAINHDIYVTVSRITSGSFYVINTTSNSVSKVAGSFTGIEGSAYDPQNNLVYLAEFNDSLAIVNATSLGIVGYLSSGFNTNTTLMTSIAYDPAMNLLFVESYAGFFNAYTYSLTGWDNLSAFSPVNNTLLGTHTLGKDSLMGTFTAAGSIAYDQSSGLLLLGGSQYLWRVNPRDWNVTLISGNLTYPGLFSIDYGSGYVYGTDGNGIFQMNSASGKVSVVTNPLNSPNSITYDPQDNELFVANLASDYITTVNATTNMLGSRVFGFHDPISIQYDPSEAFIMLSDAFPTFVMTLLSIISVKLEPTDTIMLL